MINPFTLSRISTLAIVCLLIIGSYSCKKEDFKTGLITMHYSGDSDKGGCGWLLMQDSLHAYQAVNLETKYEVEGLPLTITYKVLDQSPECTNLNILKDVVYLHKVNGL